MICPQNAVCTFLVPATDPDGDTLRFRLSTATEADGGGFVQPGPASDPDAGDVVTLNVAGLPPGATMTPPLPTSGNPVSSVFGWTPLIGQAGSYVVTFTATDQANQQALCSVTVVVTSECGDGNVDPGEQCDPGADQPNDCCTADCTFVQNGTTCGGTPTCGGPATCQAGVCTPGGGVVTPTVTA